MVMRILAWLAVLLAPFVGAKEVAVSAGVNLSRVGENRPLEVVVTVVRESGQNVDMDSFVMEGKKIKVQPAGDTTRSMVTIVNGQWREEKTVQSQYRFTIDGKPAGQYVLSPVTVEVGGKPYSSQSSTYQIVKGEVRREFRLEALVQGPSPLYPGQHAIFTYRIFFRDNIDLTLEELPLLKAQGFRLAGDKRANTFVDNGYTVQEVSQEVVALEPGTFHFGQSVIEGYVYDQDFFGRKVYKKPLLRSVAEPIQVTVAAFPVEGRPLAFTGAVGVFSLDVKMTTPTSVSVGDKVLLEVTIQGDDIATVDVPDVERQTGFMGRFRFSDLPPAATLEGNTKRVVLELRPLSADITRVPKIQFAYFDPREQKYVVLESEPIPITVTVLEISSQGGALSSPAESIPEGWRDTLLKVQPVDISGPYAIEKEDIAAPWWQTGWALMLLFMGSALVALQVALKQVFSRWRERRQRQDSRVLFAQAFQRDDMAAIKRAFLLRLVEKGLAQPDWTTPGDLPGTEGLLKEVKEVLMDIEQEQYSGRGSFDKSRKEKIKKLFGRLSQ